LTKEPKTYAVEKNTSSTNGVGKTDYSYIKAEHTPLSLSLYKNQFKMD
jgi:hypothetical protein